MMDVINWVEIGAALSFAIWLIKIGYDGEYFDEFLLSIIIQAAFTGLMWLGLRKTPFNFKYLICVLAGISFLFPMIGAILQKKPVKEAEKKKRELKARIKSGQKFRSFNTFIMNNREKIGAVSYAGKVYYSDEHPVFVDQEHQDDIQKIWNPVLGYPHRYASGGWKTQEFFNVANGERSWTYEESAILREIIKETLDSIGSWGSDSEDLMYRRATPQPVKKRNLRAPY